MTSGAIFEDAYFQTETAVVHKALHIIKRFNEARCLSHGGLPIYFNQPEIWWWPDTRERLLCESFLPLYAKYNSNTGWTSDEACGSEGASAQLHALSHYSYHSSAGALLLCDLQGQPWKSGIIVTDPVIMSCKQAAYGPADLGPAGIDTFFARHRCTKWCCSDWIKPSNPHAKFLCRESTSMSVKGPEASLMGGEPTLAELRLT